MTWPSHAKQISFTKTTEGEKVRFGYKWIDSEKKQQSLSFLLNTASVNSDFRHFKALRPSLLRMYSLKKLKQAISKLDPKQGRVTITPVQNGVEFTISSFSETWQKETAKHLRNVYQTSLKEYLYQEYYVEFQGVSSVSKPNDQTLYFKPDHRRFVEEGTTSTKPIIDELLRLFPNAPARTVAEFINSWIQTIPYDDLERRETSNGAGFEPPVHLLSKNRGDCDSKVTLMAHILKQLYPRLRMVIIYLPEHALLGLNVSVLQDDKFVEIDGLKFVLAEPVGPATIRIADASPESLRKIDAGTYTIERLY